jgi:hypothetical protein
MKYIGLGYIEPRKCEGMTEDERNRGFDNWFEYDDHLSAKPRNNAAAFSSLRRGT